MERGILNILNKYICIKHSIYCRYAAYTKHMGLILQRSAKPELSVSFFPLVCL